MAYAIPLSVTAVDDVAEVKTKTVMIDQIKDIEINGTGADVYITSYLTADKTVSENRVSGSVNPLTKLTVADTPAGILALVNGDLT